MRPRFWQNNFEFINEISERMSAAARGSPTMLKSNRFREAREGCRAKKETTMTFLMRAITPIVALAIAGPALAQQGPANADKSTPIRLAKAANSTPPPNWQGVLGQGVYMSYCGARFGCYSGIPLQCADNTRPYQNIAQHACFCVHAGCPQ
jgi:hypothetical protein